MAMSVAALLARQDLGLRLVHPGAPGALDQPVRWAHQSELPDPMSFAEPDEILLTTGIGLPQEGMASPAELAAAYDTYVRRLADSDTVALAFGTGVRHAGVPAALVDAARRHDLVVVEIPIELPFSAITKAVSRALAEEENARLRRTHAAQRRLMAAAATTDVVRSVVARTAELIGGWAAFVDPAGTVVELSHLAARATALGTFASHVRSGRQATFVEDGDTETCAYDVTTPRGVLLGVLVTGTRSVDDPLAAAVPLLATSMLAVSVSRAEANDAAMRHLRAVMMDELLRGNIRLVRAVSRDLWSGLPLEPFAVVCVTGEPAALSAVQADLVPLHRSAGAPRSAVAFGECDGHLWLVVGAREADELAARLQTTYPVVCGASSPARWEDIVQARHAAAGAAIVARARRGPGTAADAIDPGLSLLDLFDPEPSRAYAGIVLGELVRPGSRMLLDTLTTWLDHDGAIEASAHALGVHRHTVRRRLARIESLLGTELQDPRARHELWFAATLWRRHAGEQSALDGANDVGPGTAAQGGRRQTH